MHQRTSKRVDKRAGGSAEPAVRTDKVIK